MLNTLQLPRGGVEGSESMQTGFEIPFILPETATQMLQDWPRQEVGGGLTWELGDMRMCETRLAFETNEWSKVWGMGNARPVAPSTRGKKPTAVAMASPPFTLRLRRTAYEGLFLLQANNAITLYTESDSVVLPPDTEDEQGNTIPFYVDPPGQPGLHRDTFRAHAQHMLGMLVLAGVELSTALRNRAPPGVLQQLDASAAAEASRRDTEEAQAAGMEIVVAIRQERVRPPKRKGAPVVMEYLVEWEGTSQSGRSSTARGGAMWEIRSRRGRRSGYCAS